MTIEFEPDADYHRSRQFVAERVAQVGADLPPGTETPLISGVTGRLNEIFEFTLEAESGAADLMTLRDLAEFDVKNRRLRCLASPRWERLGGYLRQFQVQLDPDRMSARRVSLDEVMHAVESSNVNASGGFVRQGPMEWSVRAVGRAGSSEDLRGTVVAVRGDTPVFLGDVADAREAPAVRRGMAHRLKGEVVSARIIKQFGADTVTVAAGIHQAMESIRAGLPRGVTLRVVYDQSELVRSALGGVGRAVLLGAVFVVIVLFRVARRHARRSRRHADDTCIHRTCRCASQPPQRGAQHDDARRPGHRRRVARRRRDHRHRERGASPHDDAERTLQTDRDACRRGDGAPHCLCDRHHHCRVPSAVQHGGHRRTHVSATRRCGHRRGRWCTAPVDHAVPVLAGLLLRPHAHGASEDVWIVRGLKRLYAPVPDTCLKHPIAVMVVAAAMTAPMVVAGSRIGSDFMPQLDEGALLLQTILPPEASLDEVDRLNHRIEDLLREFPRSTMWCGARDEPRQQKTPCRTRCRMCWWC